MEVAIELSFFPLQEDYLAAIRNFIGRLRALPQLRVETTSLSTQIVGEYDLVMPLLTQELRAVLSGPARAVVIMKLLGPLQSVGGAGVAPAAPAN
ncbi:MAG TPA: hypothetical protein VKT19_05950 [Steroidobacteraceae bacterium]|nr:hypothetical protein [Steroidobacteraceae bacterium]